MNSAAWAWVTVLLEVVGTVALYDWWAIVTGHPTMSRQAHDWIYNSSVMGPIFIGLLTAIPVGLGWHFLTTHYRR